MSSGGEAGSPTAESAFPALRIRRLVRRYGGNAAVAGADLDVPAGRITALIGPNGAGKSTLFRCVAGLERADAGRILLHGRDVTRLAPHRRVRAGLAWTFQQPALFGSLTAAENLAVASQRRRGPGPTPEELLDLLGLDRRIAATPAGLLPAGTARLVEVGRALATGPAVLLLDEPAAGLDDTQARALARLLPQLARGGPAVLLIEHDLALVRMVADRICTLDRGQLTGPEERSDG